jgi:esterase/lipase superfamily enzyme
VTNDAGRATYSSERGHVVRLGRAAVDLGTGDIDWEEARRISLLKNRPGRYPLSVASLHELGVLNTSLTLFNDPAVTPDDPAPARAFAEAVDRRIASSPRPDVYLYVHGYKSEFANPILVACELWHFLGYNGVFIAYSWPATPRTMAYFSDTETARYAARNFRIFLQFLARETEARRIHIVGFSAGTRMVMRALEQLALLNGDGTKEEIGARLRIGEVCLLGSDVDREQAAAYLVDGILRVVDRLTIYQSSGDKALGFSRWVLGMTRMGQARDRAALSPRAEAFLRDTPDLTVIDVADVEGAAAGSGHAYLRKSPWVSSDVLMTLLHNLAPAERGLTRVDDSHVWCFPEDYIARLRASLAERLPYQDR